MLTKVSQSLAAPSRTPIRRLRLVLGHGDDLPGSASFAFMADLGSFWGASDLASTGIRTGSPQLGQLATLPASSRPNSSGRPQTHAIRIAIAAAPIAWVFDFSNIFFRKWATSIKKDLHFFLFCPQDDISLPNYQ